MLKTNVYHCSISFLLVMLNLVTFCYVVSHHIAVGCDTFTYMTWLIATWEIIDWFEKKSYYRGRRFSETFFVEYVSDIAFFLS